MQITSQNGIVYVRNTACLLVLLAPKREGIGIGFQIGTEMRIHLETTGNGSGNGKGGNGSTNCVRAGRVYYSRCHATGGALSSAA